MKERRTNAHNHCERGRRVLCVLIVDESRGMDWMSIECGWNYKKKKKNAHECVRSCVIAWVFLCGAFKIVKSIEPSTDSFIDNKLVHVSWNRVCAKSMVFGGDGQFFWRLWKSEKMNEYRISKHLRNEQVFVGWFDWLRASDSVEILNCFGAGVKTYFV